MLTPSIVVMCWRLGGQQVNDDEMVQGLSPSPLSLVPVLPPSLARRLRCGMRAGGGDRGNERRARRPPARVLELAVAPERARRGGGAICLSEEIPP